MRSLATAALISALLVTACGGGATTPAPTVGGQPAASQAGAANAATIVDFAFQPSSQTVAKGTSVTWTNTGSRGHTVTADDASFTSDTIAGGATFSHTFATAGTFAYHCSIHSQMKATVTVTP
ncbi:MAG TPA: plastocyanin/azurin family copper-binding protein [Candidatus Limnocylindrales bacterium]|nr:plastocyanin/azurin family copper-binding protein [Candidatus Limnocylindrales bacterium]